MKPAEFKKAVAEVTKLEGEDLDQTVSDLIVAKANAEQKEGNLKEAAAKEAAAASKKIQELEAEIEDLKASPDASKQEALIEENEKLKAELSAVKKDPTELQRCQETFKVGKKEYRFKKGFLEFRLKGEKRKAEDVAKDKDLREHLVKVKFSGIEEVPSK